MPEPETTQTPEQPPSDNRQDYVAFEAEIPFFRAGKYPQGEFTEDDLQTIADTYNPKVHEAPLTLDHEDSGPAFGWVGKVKKVGNTLVAVTSRVSDSLKQLYHEGAYRKTSAELYRNFMGFKKPYLKAITFLGAKAPQVKGLPAATFHEEYGKFVSIDFSAKEEIDMTPEEVRKMIADGIAEATASFKEENEKLQAELDAANTKFAEAEKKQKDAEDKATKLSEAETERAAQAKTADIATFCEKQKEAGKLLPAWEEMGLDKFMETLSADTEGDAVLKFEEKKDGKTQEVTVSQLGFMKTFLEAIPEVVNFDEVAETAAKSDAGKQYEGDEFDQDSVELHEKIVAFQEEQTKKGTPVSYEDAMIAVAKMEE